MLPFVGVALAVIEKMEICDSKGKGMVMRFAKLYSPEKIGLIVRKAQAYTWWRNNPTAAFMMGVGLVNKIEKLKNGTT